MPKRSRQQTLPESVGAEEDNKAPATDGQKTGNEEEQPEAKQQKQGQSADVDTAGKGSTEDPAKRPLTDDEVAKMPDSVVEQGRIYFLYRPRVGVEEAHSLNDVQRFYLIMSPTSRPDAPHRLIVIGKKRLPAVEQHERFYGFVSATGDSMEQLTQGLGETKKETKTMGTRTTAAARVAGKGAYSIVDKGGRSHLVYKLEVPEEPGEVQEELKIAAEASFSLSIRNPKTPNTQNAGLGEKADFPKEKQKEFSGHRWISASTDPSLLDYEKCELLLIGAAEDLQAELGTAGRHVEDLAADDLNNPDDDVIKQLRAELQADTRELLTESAKTGHMM